VDKGRCSKYRQGRAPRQDSHAPGGRCLKYRPDGPAPGQEVVDPGQESVGLPSEGKRLSLEAFRAPGSYLVQRYPIEQAAEGSTHGSVQVAEQGLPQVLADTPPTTAGTALSSSAWRVSRWRASFFKLFFMALCPFGR
jgi:hypothetical protein